MSDPTLHHSIQAADGAERWIYMLHGIYGAGRNWATIARRLAEARPEWGAVLVDLRLHGHSQGFAPPHTLAACAHDIRVLAETISRPAAAVLGHSFGGKVALMTAPAMHPAQVWVIDSTPSRRTPGGSGYRMLQLLKRLPPEFADRNELIAALEGGGFAPPVAHWMATNLVARGDVYTWRFDLRALEALLDDFFRRDLWDVVESPPAGTEIRFVRASESDVMTDAEAQRVRALGPGLPSSLIELHGGHWLHVDNPDGLLETLVDGLPR